MFALPYLLFLGCLGFFLFCADLIRWPISKFQLARRHSQRDQAKLRPARATIFKRRNSQKLSSSADLQLLAPIPGQAG
jgi:hypothetical protein